MSKTHILNVGKAINLKKASEHWLASDHIKEEGCWYHIIKKDSGKFLLASSYGKDNEERVELIADQSGRFIDMGTIVYRFEAKDISNFHIQQIRDLTDKTSFPFYVYK